MKERILLTISAVVDDDTGIYSIGELEYGVPVYDTVNWLDAKKERRKEFSKWLRMLADKAENNENPFKSKNKNLQLK